MGTNAPQSAGESPPGTAGGASRIRWGWCFGVLSAVLAAVLGTGVFLATGGCDGERRYVVVYAAQDRVFAEPIFREFERVSGVEVRALYDSEATKTVGLANRLIAEAENPRADVWWSNEELHTRQLARLGVLADGWKAFGERRRVLVVRTNSLGTVKGNASLAMLARTGMSGRAAISYPVFGTTTAHILALRQRWGEPAWRAWCQELAGSRPLIVDGNSVVVRVVAQGHAEVGLTDSDDVAFGIREGLPVAVVELPDSEGLRIPNTVGLVAGSHRPEAGSRLVEYLTGESVRARLAAGGAIDAVTAEGGSNRMTVEQWNRLLVERDAALDWLREVFLR